MKFALAQLNYHIGNFEGNVSKIKNAISRAKEAKANIVVFAELAISGYPPRDFLEFDHFIDQCTESINTIAKECVGIAAIIGSPSFNPNTKGKRLFNSAYFVADGKVQSIHHKALLPNYDIFDEYRYFEPNRDLTIAKYKGLNIAVTICEDLWYVSDDPLYTLCPMDELIKQKPDVIVNIAASPFNYDQNRIRKEIYSHNARQYKLPLFYVNHIGANTELLFDGGAMFINPDGQIVEELKYFEEDFKIIDTEKQQARSPDSCRYSQPSWMSNKYDYNSEFIHAALGYGNQRLFSKT